MAYKISQEFPTAFLDITLYSLQDSLSHLLATRKKMSVNAEWNREVMCIADIQMTFNNFLTVLAPNTELKADFDPLETGESVGALCVVFWAV